MKRLSVTPLLCSRRKFLAASLSSFLTLLLHPLSSLAAWLPSAFNAKSVKQSQHALWGDKKPVISDRVQLDAPKFAEDGAVVPIRVACTLENVTSISIFVEKNPVPLAAHFTLTPLATPFAATQIKLADSGMVYAVAETSEGLFMAEQNVQVSISGCG